MKTYKLDVLKILLFGANLASTGLFTYSFWQMLLNPSHAIIWRESVVPILFMEAVFATVATAANVIYIARFLKPKNTKKT